MKENKLSVQLCRIFSIILFGLLSCTFLCILIFGYENLGENVVAVKTGIILTFALMTAIAIWGYYLFINSNNRLGKFTLNSKQTNIIIFVSVGILLLIQIFVGYELRANSVSDLKIIESYCKDFAVNGNFDLIQRDYLKGSVYLVRYPNNVPFTLLLSALYRVCYLTLGYVPKMVPIVLNCVAINLSVLFTALTTKKLFGNKQALVTLALCMLFAPYYTYTAYYYTDSLSMPFLIGGVYLFVSAIKSENKYKRYALLLAFGGVVFLGFKMKATVIFALICGLIYVLLKFSIKKVATISLAVIVGFSTVGAVYSTSVNSLNLYTKEQSYECEYPFTHWIMMGLKELGHYNLEDSKFTDSFENKDEKQNANIREIKNRIEDFGVKGLIFHTVKKAVWMWEDGTYFISHHLEKTDNWNPLHSLVLDKGSYHNVFYIYSCGFQLFLIVMMILSALKGCIKPKVNKTILLKGLLFSILIFLLIWEARSRYLYNFTPVFILLAVDGLQELENFIRNKVKSRLQ